jgi:glutamine cyclotransferase
VKGEIFANIWMGRRIARIDPKNGSVKGWIDLSQLAVENSNGDPDAVLNGIAYDKKGDRLFVTGKNWAKLYEIAIVPKAKE